MKTQNISTIEKLSFLLLRVLGSGIFLVAGFNHLFQTAMPAAKLQKAPFGYLATAIAPAETLVFLSGIALVVGGLLFLLGYQTRKVALLLILILIPITITIQVGSAETTGPLFKNIAIFGILIFHLINGAKYYSVDQWLSAKPRSSSKLMSKVPLAVAIVLISGMVFFLSSFTGNPNVSKTSEVRFEKKTNYAVLISQPDHLKAAVNTAQTMQKNPKYHSGEFVVMACGKSVEAFQKGSELAEIIEAGKVAGIKFKVCGFSLKKFNIDPAQLLDGQEVVENGLTFMFDVKQQGYVTVEL